MYVGTFNDTENFSKQKCHNNEQEFGNLWGLPAQNDFPSFFPKQ